MQLSLEVSLRLQLSDIVFVIKFNSSLTHQSRLMVRAIIVIVAVTQVYEIDLLMLLELGETRCLRWLPFNLGF